MTTNLLRAGAASCALITALLSASAAAQPQPQINQNVAPAAEQLAVTPGGVDIRTGRYANTEIDLTIGSEGGALALNRSMSPGIFTFAHNSFGNFTHNWDIVLLEHRVDMDTLNYLPGIGQDYRVIVNVAGRSDTFDSPENAPGYVHVSTSPQATLSFTGTKSNAVYTFQGRDGTLALFRSISGGDCGSGSRCAFVSQITEPDGTRLNFEYDAGSGANHARLRSVTSNRGYALLLEYGGTGGGWSQVSKACVINLTAMTKPANNVCPGNAQATASYSYTTFQSAPRLASVTDPNNATSSYTYQSANGLVEMRYFSPNEATRWMQLNLGWGNNDFFGASEVVYGQQFGNGEYFAYDLHDPSVETNGANTRLTGGYYTNALNEQTRVEYDFPRRPVSMNPVIFDQNQIPYENLNDAYFQTTPGPARIIDPLNRTTTMDYCDPYAQFPQWEQSRCIVGPLRAYTDPEGIRTELTYDGYGNVTQTRRIAKAGSGLADIFTAATYLCGNRLTCHKPLTVTRARHANEPAATTTYTYDSTHGGITSETGPVVNGIQPQTRYEYTQRYAWISNGAGGYVQAATPVWLLTATSLCRTSAPTGSPCATSGDEVRTSFDYGPNSGPNNLLLRGQVVTADGVSLRTCYRYDANGRRISETQPNGTTGLSSCP